MVCVECGVQADRPASGWQAHRSEDPELGGVPEVALYCPMCALREFGRLDSSSLTGRSSSSHTPRFADAVAGDCACMDRLPVSYETLIEQIAVAQELMERLRAKPGTPKILAARARVADAQTRMLTALAQCESEDREVDDN